MPPSISRKDLLDAIRVRLAESPVVALLGARQVGKTTLAEQVAAAWDGPTVVFDLEHLWVVYPGTLRYPLAEKITVLPLREIPGLELRVS